MVYIVEGLFILLVAFSYWLCIILQAVHYTGVYCELLTALPTDCRLTGWLFHFWH